jgi:hypothetical protein
MAINDSTPATSSVRSKVTVKPRARRKSSCINPKVIANIVHLSDERKKENAREKWGVALNEYLRSLGHHEFDIAKHVIMFISQKPSLIDSSYSCKVIPFPFNPIR